jgi:hypothetical protein
VNHIGSSGRDDVLGRDRTVSELFRSASGLFPNRPHTILFGNVTYFFIGISTIHCFRSNGKSPRDEPSPLKGLPDTLANIQDA